MGRAWQPSPFALSEVEMHVRHPANNPAPTRQTDLTYRNSPRYGGKPYQYGEGGSLLLAPFCTTPAEAGVQSRDA